MEFGPLPENIFASHGCKQVETKVVLQIALEDENSNFRLFDELWYSTKYCLKVVIPCCIMFNDKKSPKLRKDVS